VYQLFNPFPSIEDGTTIVASATKKGVGTLIVGIGSPHGDDQAGWKVIERLEPLQWQWPSVELRQATVPHDLIDWLEGKATLHLIDGCICNGHVSDGDNLPYQRFEWVEDAIDLESSLRFEDTEQRPLATTVLERRIELRSGGSHQIDALSVLELAACLHRLPKQVVIWAIPGKGFGPGKVLTESCEHAMASCIVRLTEELSEQRQPT
jgi:Ni,Fe-hydrogenase maturation factor